MRVILGCSGGVPGVFRGCSGGVLVHSDGVWEIFWGVPDLCPDITQPRIACLTWRSGTSVIKVDQTEGAESMSTISSIECHAVNLATLINKIIFSLEFQNNANGMWAQWSLRELSSPSPLPSPPTPNTWNEQLLTEVIEGSKCGGHGSNSYHSSNLSLFQVSKI